MENGQGKNIMEASLEYSRMAELLKKSRPSEAALMVKQILESGESLQEKIRKIELIDAQEVGQEIDETPLSSEEVQEIIKKKRVSTEDVASKNSEKIKVKFIRKPFFLYLFRDYRRIREFGRAAGFLRFGFTPGSMKFDFLRLRTTLNSLQKDAVELMENLNLVLDKGWMYLDKESYNLIVIFRSLCQALVSAPVLRQGSTPKQLLDAYWEVETLFLTCNYKIEYPEIICSSITEVLENLRKPDGLIELSQIQVKRILRDQGGTPSLYNFIMCINMFDSRRYVRIDDLIRRQPGGVVNTFSFECSPFIQQKINVYINDKTTTWQNLIMEKAEINRIQYFLKHFIRQDSSGYRSYNFKVIMDFYEYATYGEIGDSFTADKNNTAKLAYNFFRKFLTEFENFLIDRVVIEDFGPVRVFSGEVFQLEVDKLRMGVLKFEDIVFTLPILSRREFFDLKTSKKDMMPAPPALALIQTVDSISDILADIGEKLGNIHINFKKDITANQNAGSASPLEISATRQKSVFVPFWDKRILSPGFLKEKFFSDSVAMITSLCFLADMYFYNMRFYAILEKEMKINNMIIESRKTIERLADVVTFEKIKKMQAG